MRVAGITALGEPVEIFEVDELATPAAGEVLIDVVAAGIGNWDELVRIGSWQIGGPAPMALGTEAAGTVAAVGSGTLNWIDQFSSDVDCSFAPDVFIPFNLDINSVAVKGSEGFAGLQGRLTFTDTTFSGVLH